METVTLVNGVEMPIIGFGSIIPEGRETITAVKNAVKAGYKPLLTIDHVAGITVTDGDARA